MIPWTRAAPVQAFTSNPPLQKQPVILRLLLPIQEVFCLENTPNTMPASSNTNVHHGRDVAHHLADSNVY